MHSRTSSDLENLTEIHEVISIRNLVSILQARTLEVIGLLMPLSIIAKITYIFLTPIGCHSKI